jgi:hypothetical protein
MPTKAQLEAENATLRAQLANPRQDPQHRREEKWQQWIRGIGFGSYLLAALGIIFYAQVIRQVEPSWDNLRPYVISIVIMAIALLIIDLGMRFLKPIRDIERIAKYVINGLAVLFLLLASLVSFWFAVFILQDTGMIPMREDYHCEFFRPSDEPRPLAFSSNIKLEGAKPQVTYHFVEDDKQPGYLGGVYITFPPRVLEIRAILRLRDHEPLPVIFKRGCGTFKISDLRPPE